MVTGREAILARAGQLEELALRSGQPGAMHGLHLLLGSRYALRKRPHLLCFTANPIRSQQESLQGAVLLLEYCLAGIGTGLFATADSFGVRTVIAAGGLRGGIAAAACVTMLRRGARIVLVSFKHQEPSLPLGMEAEIPADAAHPFMYALGRRETQDTLRLGANLEKTLATLGRRTRVHMRAARRRFERMFPHAVLTGAAHELASSDTKNLRSINQSSLDTIDQRDFNHQVRSICGSADSFVLGLRDGNRWLALVAGWRQGHTTWVEWQVNAAGYEKLSLGSVMRSYLLEHENALGMHQVGFHGGTSHSMGHSFVREDVLDLLGRRRGFVSWLLVTLAHRICAMFPRLKQRGNFMLDALAAENLTWTSRTSNAREKLTQ